jgi:hypothetical protein
MKLEAYLLEQKVRIIKEVRIWRDKVWSWIISRVRCAGSTSVFYKECKGGGTHMYMCLETLSSVLLAETQDANYLDLEA